MGKDLNPANSGRNRPNLKVRSTRSSLYAFNGIISLRLMTMPAPVARVR
jgi:hypothetical protein